MKKIFLLSLIIVSLVLSGCVYKYKEDYTVKYKEILDYAFGDWEVVSESVEVYKTNVGLDPDKEYISWEISYVDQDGKKRIFQMDNMGLYSFTGQLKSHYGQLFYESFKSDIDEIPYQPSVYLIDAFSWHELLKQYDENPVKIIDNYGDIVDFQTFNPSPDFENSGYYLSLRYDFREELTDEEKHEIISEGKQIVFNRFPTANLKISVFGEKEKSEYYIAGEKIDLRSHNRYEEFQGTSSHDASDRHYATIVRELAPHLNIEE